MVVEIGLEQGLECGQGCAFTDQLRKDMPRVKVGTGESPAMAVGEVAERSMKPA